MDPDWGLLFLFGIILLAKNGELSTVAVNWFCLYFGTWIWYWLWLLLCARLRLLLIYLLVCYSNLWPWSLVCVLVLIMCNIWYGSWCCLDDGLHAIHAMLIRLQLWPCGAACGVHIDVYLWFSAVSFQMVLFLSSLQYWCYTCSFTCYLLFILNLPNLNHQELRTSF